MTGFKRRPALLAAGTGLLAAALTSGLPDAAVAEASAQTAGRTVAGVAEVEVDWYDVQIGQLAPDGSYVWCQTGPCPQRYAHTNTYQVSATAETSPPLQATVNGRWVPAETNPFSLRLYAGQDSGEVLLDVKSALQLPINPGGLGYPGWVVLQYWDLSSGTSEFAGEETGVEVAGYQEFGGGSFMDTSPGCGPDVISDWLWHGFDGVATHRPRLVGSVAGGQTTIRLESYVGPVCDWTDPVGSFPAEVWVHNAQGVLTADFSFPGDIRAGALAEAPVFTASDPPTTSTVGVEYAYTFTASAQPAATFALSAAPAWLGIDPATGRVAGTPPAGTTSFSYVVVASNGNAPDATSPTFTVTVQSAPVPEPPPAVSTQAPPAQPATPPAQPATPPAQPATPPAQSATASGASSPASPTPVSATGRSASVRVKAVSGRSKLHVDVNPNKGKGYWRLQVQRKRADGTWQPLKTYRTKGKSETRTLNLRKGTYRVWVNPKYGYRGVMSAEVSLKR